MKADGTLLNFKQYAAFGEQTHDTLGVTRQGIYKLRIDNGKLTMNRQENIANYTIGNCQLAFDSLWEKYFGWTPYQYCMNKIN
ncbi:MAG: hypothetical protein KIT33_08560 [Candidatus Kapabacteria bacterium]|nr:hypothetical protein [Ignavibacteriota bacterium]MCW5885007.1 hypothetical protein [Candidatus Kapabacteria bacterium]